MCLLGRSAAVPAAVAAVTTVDTTTVNDVELLAEAHRLVGKAAELAGGFVPGVGTAAWWDAGPLPRLAGLLVLAERALLVDPDRLAAEQLKAAAVAISTGRDWAAAAVPHSALVARRAEPGPMARTVDRKAAARWAATGTSTEEVA